jgi:hypothetical protein
MSARGRRSLWLALAAAAVVLIAVGTVIVARRSRSSQQPADVVAAAIAERRARAVAAAKAGAKSARPTPARGTDSRGKPAARDPQRALRDSSWESRLVAAKALAKRANVPVPRRAELLLAALRREVSAPTTAPPAGGSYLSASSLSKLHLAQTLGALGAEATPVLRQGAAASGGEAREWTLIALGYAGAREAAPPLRQLLATSPRGEVRMSAAHVLGKLRDRDAIPALRAALADPFTATVARDDVRGAPSRRLYPVRARAASALRTLGVAVERRGDGFVVRQ